MASKTKEKEEMKENFADDLTLVYKDHTVKVMVKGDYFSDELADLFVIAVEECQLDYRDVKKVVFVNNKGNRLVNLVTKE